MTEKEVFFSLPKVLLAADGKSVNKKFIEIILAENLTVICVNQSMGKKRLMPFKSLYDHHNNFWQKDGNWEDYFSKESVEKIKEKAAAKPNNWEKEIPITAGKNEDSDESELEELDVEAGFGIEYKTFAEMSSAQKVERLNENKQKLNAFIVQEPKDSAAVTELLVDTAKDAALINHAALEEALRFGDDEAKKLTQEIVDSTQEMVKSSAQLVASDILNNELINTLVEKSNGTIVQHMTRVYLNGIAFIAYYNNLVSTTSIIQKMRISFASKYRDFYHKLLPQINIDDINLERVFLGGMRAIPPELYFKWATGFLIHDIGKAAAIEYHEGEAAYDRNTVIEHVKAGYKSVMNKTNYPMEASLIIGYHHEYYGDPDGYGYFRAYLQQYKSMRPDAKIDYCITYELEPMLDYHALAYFPAKVLEIIDVYDSLTDPHRAYRRAMTPEEALAMMKTEFIEKHTKIDAIIFDVFAGFIREHQKEKQ